MRICSGCGGGYIGAVCEACPPYIEPSQAAINESLRNMQDERDRLAAAGRLVVADYATTAG